MIGIFDSGLGGLTIFKAIEQRLSEYDFMYLGDNARAPYGDHNQETILNYTKQGVSYLFEQGCILVILACNTASAEALRELQQKWLPSAYPDRNILGVIRPLSEAAAYSSRGGVVGVMATRSTVLSGAYVRELKQQNKSIRVVQSACRLLVPMIEEGYERKPELRMVLKRYVRTLKNDHVDTVILGCTHYGLISDDISRYLGKNVIILDSGAIVAGKLVEYLKRHPEFDERIGKKQHREFLSTENTADVAPLVKKFLGRPVDVSSIQLT